VDHFQIAANIDKKKHIFGILLALLGGSHDATFITGPSTTFWELIVDV